MATRCHNLTETVADVVELRQTLVTSLKGAKTLSAAATDWSQAAQDQTTAPKCRLPLLGSRLPLVFRMAAESGKHLIAKPVLGGLHHVYRWAAWPHRWSFCAL